MSRLQPEHYSTWAPHGCTDPPPERAAALALRAMYHLAASLAEEQAITNRRAAMTRGSAQTGRTPQQQQAGPTGHLLGEQLWTPHAVTILPYASVCMAFDLPVPKLPHCYTSSNAPSDTTCCNMQYTAERQQHF